MPKGGGCGILPGMTIPPNATQEELEELLRRGLRHSMRTLVLAGVLLSPFCYLRCLVNPLWVLGLKVPGIFVTALFGCYVGWQYVQGNPAAGESALLWWAVWAGIMLILHYILYALSPLDLYRQSRKYRTATGGSSSGIAAPQGYRLELHKNAEGYGQSELLLHAPQRGLYALRWEISGYSGELRARQDERVTPPAWSELETQQNSTILTELYRLEPGNHRLCLQLADRDAPAPECVMITQLNMD